MTRKQAAATTVLGHAILLIPAAALLFGGDASARTPADIGRPPIGTEAYSAGCVITDAYEDGSAVATCADSVTWVFDPDGEPVSGRTIGWFVQD